MAAIGMPKLGAEPGHATLVFRNVEFVCEMGACVMSESILFQTVSFWNEIGSKAGVGVGEALRLRD